MVSKPNFEVDHYHCTVSCYTSGYDFGTYPKRYFYWHRNHKSNTEAYTYGECTHCGVFGGGVTTEYRAPTIRFLWDIATPNQTWDLAGGDEFFLMNINNNIKPLAIKKTGEIDLMEKVSLNVQGIAGTNDNRLALMVNNTKRQIFWSSYKSTSGNDTQVPLEFMYDAQGGGAVDVSVMKLMPNGNVGIGASVPIARLHVSGGDLLVTNGTFTINNGVNQFKVYTDGKVRAREVAVDLQTIPDYVFESDYPLMGIMELKTCIKSNKHLPGIRSEKEYVELGSIPMGELNLKLLEKVEELSLYVISLKEELDILKSQVRSQK